MNEVIVKAENVSKIFCRSLKKSLWYGVKDIGKEIVGRRLGNHDKNDLRKDEFWAVDDVSFELKRGECLGLIGENGAGKSTLLKMLNGLIKPDRGRIEMRGRVGALIQLGAGFEISIKNLSKLIARLTDFRGVVVWDTSKPNGQPRRMLDTSRAYAEFGFRVAMDFEEGLKRTIDWYRSNSNN